MTAFHSIAPYWYSINTMLLGICLYLSINNYRKFDWGWEEKRVILGTILFMGGAFLGYGGRILSPAIQISAGTPIITIGLIFYIYGTLGAPDRPLTKESHEQDPA